MSALDPQRLPRPTAWLPIAAVMLFGVFGLVLRNDCLNTPIYASDEYAYLISGKLFHQLPAVLHDDPGLQRLSNLLYFRLVNAAFTLTANGWNSLRALNVILYAVVGLVSAALVARVTRSSLAVLFLVLYFLLPWSGYTVSVMPEVVAYFAVMLVACTAIAALRLQSLSLCGAAGLLTAGAYYIKPNVVGVALGTVVFFLLYFEQNGTRGSRARRGSIAAFTFLSALAVGLLVWRWIAVDRATAAPALVSGLYAGELSRSSGGAWVSFLACIRYCVAHLTVLALFFPAGLAGIICLLSSGRETEEGTGRNETLRALARWFVWVAGFSILAVSYYSIKSGADGAFGQRLHGRYLGFLFPILLLFTIVFVDRVSSARRDVCNSGREALIASALLLSGVAIWMLFVEAQFRIYPWDYPELTALFRGNNGYWNEPALWSTRAVVLFSAVLAAGVVALRPRRAGWLVIVYLGVCMVLGNRNNTAFQARTSASLGLFSQQAGALTAVAGLDHRRGLVVGSDRYGYLSYVLFGIGADVVVETRPFGAEVDAKDLFAGCEWVLFAGEFVPHFAYCNAVKNNRFTLFYVSTCATPSGAPPPILLSE